MDFRKFASGLPQNSRRPHNTIQSLSRRRPRRQKKCIHGHFFGPVWPSPPPPRVKRKLGTVWAFSDQRDRSPRLQWPRALQSPVRVRETFELNHLKSAPSQLLSGFDRLQTCCHEFGPANILYIFFKCQLISSSF
jgi:hypothetical protein